MRRILLSISLASALAVGAVSAQDNPPPAAPLPAAAPAGPRAAPTLLDDDPAPLLGLDVSQAVERCGPPASVYAVRGAEAWQDDVAFRYAAGYTLFLYGDRLWQLRFSSPYGGSVYGLFVGDGVDKAYSLLGEPFERDGSALVYRMPYRGYPVRLRLDAAQGRLTDIYVYRADF